MRLDTLTIKGVLAFEEERSLSFRELPEGLIALRGPIGQGKTTLLEAPAATLFRQFPSREKKPPFDYATGTDAFMQLVFELEGRGLYRARLNLDGVHRKQEAVLLRRDPSGAESFVSDRQSLKSYDAAVATLLPPVEDWLASILAIQTRRGSFSEADRAERRVMLQTLMGLDTYEQLAERARGAVALASEAVLQATAGLTLLEADERPETAAVLSRRATDLDREIHEIDAHRLEIRGLMTTTEALLASLEGETRAYDAAFARHRAAEQTITLRTAEREQLKVTIAETIRAGEAERARRVQSHADWITRNQAAQRDTSLYTKEVERLDAALAATVAAAEARIAVNRTELGREATIRAAVAEITVLDQQLAAKREAAAAATVALDGHTAAERLLSATIADLRAKAATLARAEADAALLGQVPCEGAGPYEFCDLLSNAQRAKDQIHTLEQTPALLATATAEHQDVLGRSDAARAAFTAAGAAIAALEARRTIVKRDADKLAALTVAKDRNKALEQSIVDAKAKHADDVAAAVSRSLAHVARLKDEATHRTEEHAAALATVDDALAARLATLHAQDDRLRDAIDGAAFERDEELAIMDASRDAAARANAAALTLAAYREKWDTATGLSATLQAQLDTLEADVSQLVARAHRIEIQRARLDHATAQEREWSQLVAACCREGLPTLEIDAAAPRLTDLFNDLLLASFGGRFTGRLVTQKAKAGGAKNKSGATHNEVIEFQIYDQEKGGAERDLHDLSGGQKIVVEEALRSAIALMVNARSENPMRTCWRDETTGSLDPASAIAYISMLQRVKEIGGFYHVIFATHSPACWHLAQSQVIVGGGDWTVALPPYAQDVE